MYGLKRNVKNLGKRHLRNLLEFGQKFGISILPVHFYSEVPDLQELRKEDYWKQPHSMFGVNGNDLQSQLSFVKECCSEELQERLKKGDIYAHACAENGEPGFGLVEADFLFCFIYSKRPKRIIQVGCGVSTSVMLLASQESDYKPEIICIEPYPTEFLQKSDKMGKITLIPEKAQKISLDILTNLGDEGMLFIDSTHTVKPGSEVNRLILEVLPRLKPGSFVHFHDIYFPYEYSRDILSKALFFPNETVLLHAFLINNKNSCIKASLSMLHYAKKEELQKLLPNYEPEANEYGLEVSDARGHFPSSVYLQVI
ncbi:class I SAM-dependent methyltransferase [Microseira wollei]|uniref:Class I SAM-dependent methyltransferase n=1 Tax=Microseira wollei NIES-4236 TaxID=2530354 RepID=A0AAV3XFI9_9CYAN|nr:class I SAM-dependent methyltransferase [Microseira wollei]GET40266.1 hypothetical protein MiSe_50750 [Microseira wollei NIES-4236]